MANTVPRNTDRAARIAERLNHLRKTAGISTETLSQQTGIPKRTLDRKLTTTPHNLSLADLILLTDALHVPLWSAFEDAA